jgi:hypothetical protein
VPTTPTIHTTDEYREQIRHCARSLSLARNDAVAALLAPGHAVPLVKMFTDGNLDKRFQKLSDHLELLAEDFEDLEELIVEYVKTVPLAAYDTGASDGERFLDWLCERRELTAEQQDVVTCQRSRHAVEALAQERRLAHVRFQELLQSAEAFALELGANPDLWIHANPIHVEATLHTHRLLDAEDELPALVAFFPVGNDVRTAVLEDAGRRLFGCLAESGPQRLADLQAAGLGADRSELIELCLDLADVGLAAFG